MEDDCGEKENDGKYEEGESGSGMLGRPECTVSSLPHWLEYLGERILYLV